MSKRSHLWVGFLFGLTTAFTAHAPANRIPVITALIAAGGILPDFDMFYTDNKPFNQRNMLTSHRGWTHHPLNILLFFMSAFFFHIADTCCIPEALFYIGIGIALHDLLDMFSPLGIPHPFRFRYLKRISVPLYKTGGVSEYVILAVISLLLAAALLISAKKVYARNNFHLNKAYSRYLYLSDNKTVEKYGALIKNAKRNINGAEGEKSARESYEYYKRNILPYVNKKAASLSGRKKRYSLLAKNSYIYIFMSSSVPRSTWKNYIKAIDKLRSSGQDGIGIVLRGCIGGCTKVLPTAKFIYSLLKHGKDTYKVPVLLDPLLFRLFKIKRVPVIVYAKHVNIKTSWLSPGIPDNLENSVTAYKIIGDCGFPYALKELYGQSGDGAVLGLFNILTAGWLER